MSRNHDHVERNVSALEASVNAPSVLLVECDNVWTESAEAPHGEKYHTIPEASVAYAAIADLLITRDGCVEVGFKSNVKVSEIRKVCRTWNVKPTIENRKLNRDLTAASIVEAIRDHYGLNVRIPVVHTERAQNTPLNKAQDTLAKKAGKAHAAAVKALRAAGAQKMANDMEKAWENNKNLASLKGANPNAEAPEQRGLDLAIYGGRKWNRDRKEWVVVESDALEVNLLERMQQGGRQTKPLPGGNGRVAAPITTGMSYGGMKVRMSRHWKPLNLPIYDPQTGRFVSSRGSVRLARAEVRTGHIHTDDSTRWEVRVKMGNNHGTYSHRIGRVAVHMTQETVAVWAVILNGAVC